MAALAPEAVPSSHETAPASRSGSLRGARPSSKVVKLAHLILAGVWVREEIGNQICLSRVTSNLAWDHVHRRFIERRRILRRDASEVHKRVPTIVVCVDVADHPSRLDALIRGLDLKHRTLTNEDVISAPTPRRLARYVAERLKARDNEMLTRFAEQLLCVRR
jgi:hypothetical protein